MSAANILASMHLRMALFNSQWWIFITFQLAVVNKPEKHIWHTKWWLDAMMNQETSFSKVAMILQMLNKIFSHSPYSYLFLQLEFHYNELTGNTQCDKRLWFETSSIILLERRHVDFRLLWAIPPEVTIICTKSIRMIRAVLCYASREYMLNVFEHPECVSSFHLWWYTVLPTHTQEGMWHTTSSGNLMSW